MESHHRANISGHRHIDGFLYDGQLFHNHFIVRTHLAFPKMRPSFTADTGQVHRRRIQAVFRRDAQVIDEGKNVKGGETGGAAQITKHHIFPARKQPDIPVYVGRNFNVSAV
jgi:hypothetical protein